MEVFAGRGPGPAKAMAAVVDPHDGSAEPDAEPKVEPPPSPPAADSAAEVEAPPADAPEGTPEADAPADAPEADAPEADAPAADPAAGGRSEADWLKLAKVRLGTAKVDGALDPEVIRAGVRSNIKNLRQCYAQGLAKAPELTGKLTVEFVVDKKGKIDSSAVKSSTHGDAAVDACVLEVINGWKFDAPEDGKKVKVRQPLTLAL